MGDYAEPHNVLLDSHVDQREPTKTGYKTHGTGG